jgi:hypothetical protein
MDWIHLAEDKDQWRRSCENGNELWQNYSVAERLALEGGSIAPKP